MSSVPSDVAVYLGEALASYGFGDGHPFGSDRYQVFCRRLMAEGLTQRVQIRPPVAGTMEDACLFHTPDYVEFVAEQSRLGRGYLDGGDTPVFPGVLEAALMVVGTVLDAVHVLISGGCRRAFVPIAGLHHARRDAAAGFCVFNDCGIAIEALRRRHGLRRIAYVDIDAHHGDGVYYGFEEDPDLITADLHEDGRFLYPGTGAIDETGRGPAVGTKLNIPLPPEADDALFYRVWDQAEAFVERQAPELILLQCGADSIAGDPITHLRFTPAAHAHAARRLCALADRHCQGRLLALGGGGYNRDNLAAAWTGVVRALVEADR